MAVAYTPNTSQSLVFRSRFKDLHIEAMAHTMSGCRHSSETSSNYSHSLFRNAIGNRGRLWRIRCKDPVEQVLEEHVTYGKRLEEGVADEGRQGESGL